MRFGNLMILYDRQTRKDRLKGWTIMVLFTIAIMMVHMAVYEQELSRYYITVTRQLFQGHENLYNIRVWVTDMSVSTMEGTALFLEKLKGLSGVEMSGRFYDCNEIFVELQEDQEFVEYNRRLMEGTEREMDIGFFDMYYTDRDLASLLGVGELSAAKHGDIIPVLAGYDYRDYLHKGEIYTNMDGIRYQICGVLPEGFCLPATLLLDSAFPCEIMDDKLIALYDDVVDPMHIYILNGANSIYCVTDGKTETVERIRELAGEAFIHIDIEKVEDRILQYEEDRKWSLRMVALFTGITVLAAFLAMLSLSVIRIILKKQEYGILFANGISRGEGVKLIALENGIRQGMAFLLGTAVTDWRIRDTAFTYVFQKRNLFREMVVWKTFLIVFLVFVGSVSIPAIVLGKMKTIELLGENEL